MESILKFLVILVVIAGMLWVVSPIVTGAISSSSQKAPDLKVSQVTYSMSENPPCDCAPQTCKFSGSGTLYNFGGDAKNILLTVYSFDNLGKNVGSVNLPLIESIGEQQTHPFSFAINFSCNTLNVSIGVLHSERA